MKLNLMLLLPLTCYLAGFCPENSSEQSKKALFKISIMYPAGEGKTFDFEYYQKKHMPMVAKYIGSNLVKYTIEKGITGNIPNQSAPFAAIGTFYVRDIKKYEEAVGPYRAAIREDIKNYTNIVPVIFMSEVLK